MPNKGVFPGLLGQCISVTYPTRTAERRLKNSLGSRDPKRISRTLAARNNEATRLGKRLWKVRVDFHCRVLFTCVNKLEAMYKRSRVNVKVEPGRHVKMKRQWKSTLRDERPRILNTQGRSCKEISI